MPRDKELEENPKQIGSVYFHISNSGVTFQVVDEGWGPTIIVSGSSFGNMNSQLKLHVDNKGLAQLSKLFAKAAEVDYSKDYVCKANGTLKLGEEDGD